MKNFKIELEGQVTEYKTRQHKRFFNYSREGFFDLFKGKSSQGKEPEKKPEKEYTFEDFEKEFETSKSISIHLDCDTIDNQIKFLKAYKDVLIPILIKEMDKLEHVLKFIKSKGTSIVDYTDDLVNMSWPKYSSYKANLRQSQYPEFNIHFLTSTSIEKQKEKKYTENDIYNVEAEYPNITDRNEQIRIVRLLTYADHIVVPIYLEIKKHREKNQEKTILNIDDPKFKTYTDLSFEIIRKLESLKSRHDELIDLVYEVENSDFPEYGDGDEYGIARLVIHNWDFFYEIVAFEKYFLRNNRLSNKLITISTESFNDIATESMAIAQEGKIEQIKSFFQRAVSTKESMKKAIVSLQGKEVKEIFYQEDGGKFSGLKLLDLDKVDGKAIIKYLELVKRESNEAHSLAKRAFDKATAVAKLLEKDVHDDKEHDKLYSQIFSIENEVEQLFDELKKHTAATAKKDKIKIQSASKEEFDKILQLFSSVVESDFLEKIEGYLLETYDYYELDDKDTDANKVFDATQELLTQLFYYLERFDAFEDKFLFSLMKYLQASVK